MPQATIEGMTCNHCKQAVTKALESIEGITKVHVDLLAKKATWEETTPVGQDVIAKAITSQGFGIHFQ